MGERFAGPGQGALHGHTPGASDEPSGDEEDHAAYASEGACLPSEENSINESCIEGF